MAAAFLTAREFRRVPTRPTIPEPPAHTAVHVSIQANEGATPMRRLILASVLITVLAVPGLFRPGLASAHEHAPSQEDIDFAKKTTNLLFATLFAALTQEFDETVPENVEQGKVSIGLVFSDTHSNFRLVGKFGPLRQNDRPQDSFERRALQKALDNGELVEEVEKIDGDWFFRRSIPLSVFRAECVLCHSNFEGLGATDYVGALMLKVPVE
jgi:hypothetical protein